jgi:cellulose synthase/poly-beta-1,6-N-acetylglucosamine synthase-like glycosyltransferase
VSVTVVVPTFKRPLELLRCLQGIAAQTQPPTRVIVVVNTADPASRPALVSAPLPVDVVEVDRPGVLAALRAGIAQADGAWVAVLDDDAVPEHDWLERAARWFNDPSVGGVGGLVIDHRPVPPMRRRRAHSAGKVSRLGLVHSAMNRPGGPLEPVETDFLPGSNMLYRRQALPPDAFDLRMSFGIAPHFEADVGAAVRSRGWRIVYDPSVRVQHLPAPRGHDLERDNRPAQARAEAHNLAYHSLKHRGLLRTLPLVAFLVLVGQRAHPGVAFLLLRPARRTAALVSASLGGVFTALLAREAR